MFTQVFTILPLTCAIFVFMFGLFILSKDRHSRINQLLFGFCMSMFFWMFGTFMMFGLRGSNRELALFWDRFVYLGVVFMPPFMHHFSLVFTKMFKQKNLLYINYAVAFLFFFISRTELFVNDLYLYDWGAHSQARFFHHVFLLYFFLGTGLFFRNIFLYYRKTHNKEERIQALYIFVAFAIVIFVGGSAYLYAYGIDTKFPYAYISGLIFPIMLFYAVSRHHLLRIKILGTEILVGLANFVIVTEIFIAKSIRELLLRIVFAVLIFVISILLIMSIEKEIKRREEISKLATSLERANFRLKELDRQKTEFLSIASHQLRTPLSIIKGYIELISDGAYGRATDKMKQVLRDMDESNERLVKLVDEFLDITRIEQGRTKFSFDIHDMKKLISSVVDELRDRGESKGLKIVWKPNKKVDMNVFMDDEKIRHVIFNYIDNAIKYTTRGSVAISCLLDRKDMIVRVKDTGIGFGEEDEVNFFQKFYRGKNVKGTNVNGTGLGIYVCRKFIEAHGGKVWAKSSGKGKGGEFGFQIPSKRGNKAKVVEKDATHSDPETGAVFPV